MKIEFLLLPEDGEQSEKKLNESLCSTRCCMAALHRGICHRSHGEGIVDSFSNARDYIPAAVPSGAAQEARCPAGTQGDIQIVALGVSKCRELKVNIA